MNRIVEFTDQNDYRVRYRYRADGQKLAVTVADPCDWDRIIYAIRYDYDLAGRLTNVREPLADTGYQSLAELDYDDNGNREYLKYYLTGSEAGTAVTTSYIYNRDNLLEKFSTTGGGLTFEFGKYNGATLEEAEVDGLGRLTTGHETLEINTGGTVRHDHSYDYDRRSQLTDTSISNINQSTWAGDYNYANNGDLSSRTVTSTSSTSFTYSGHKMTAASGGESFSVGWDDNGNIGSNNFAQATTLNYTFNWDNKLREADWNSGSDVVHYKYDPDGNLILRKYNTDERRYVVDIVGDLPVILLEIDSDDDTIAKSYYHANGQILAQRDGDVTGDKYFYMHDRLGSVRQVIDSTAAVVVHYTYEPFGEIIESSGSFSNPWRFTGQFYDSEIAEYHLRARNYNPHMARFTGRDPVLGKFEEPLTLHRYLYCWNDPVSNIDLSGRFGVVLGLSFSGNLNMSNTFGKGWLSRTSDSTLGAATRSSGVLQDLGFNSIMGYYNIALPYMSALADLTGAGPGGTVGLGLAFTCDHEETGSFWDNASVGLIGWGAIGLSVSTSTGYGAAVDLAISPEARCMGDLLGNFVEAGGSISTGIPAPGIPGFIMGGGSIAWGLDDDGNYTGITLRTASIGAGTKGPGAEAHGFFGRTSLLFNFYNCDYGAKRP